MAKKHADIIRCLRCERIKAWGEDCSYLGCNPELHWQEARAVEVYSALHPEGVERDRLRGEVEALREALQAISDEYGVIHKGTWMDPDAEVYSPISRSIQSTTILRARAVLAAVPAEKTGA